MVLSAKVAKEPNSRRMIGSQETVDAHRCSSLYPDGLGNTVDLTGRRNTS